MPCAQENALNSKKVWVPPSGAVCVGSCPYCLPWG